MLCFIYVGLFLAAVDGCTRIFGVTKYTNEPLALKQVPVNPSWPPLPPAYPEAPILNWLREECGVHKVPLLLHKDKLVGQMRVGTPKNDKDKSQTFAMYINLYSEMVWLPSVDLCGLDDCIKKPYRVYKPDKSRVFRKNGYKKDTIDHIQFKVSGVISTDSFKIGGYNHEFIIDSQEFVKVDKIDGYFEGFDGMFGLKLVSHSTSAPICKLRSLFESKDPVFGIYLYREPTKEVGYLTIGGQDKSFWSGEFTKHNVVKYNEEYNGWDISIEKLVIKYNTGEMEEIALPANTVANVAPDVDDIELPLEGTDQFYNLLFKKVELNHLNGKFDCKDVWSSLPVVVLVLDGHEYLITSEYYKGYEYLKCKVAFKRVQSPGRVKLGRKFMKRFYTRFDFKNFQVQFANSKSGLVW